MQKTLYDSCRPCACYLSPNKLIYALHSQGLFHPSEFSTLSPSSSTGFPELSVEEFDRDFPFRAKRPQAHSTTLCA